MKTIKFLLLNCLLFSFIGFTSCSDDDDSSSDGGSECFICNMSQGGVTFEQEICDNGDGTATTTIMVEGQETEETFSLEGASFDDFVDAFMQSGLCDN